MNITQKELSYYCGETRLSGVLVYGEDYKRTRPDLVLAPNMMDITKSNIDQASSPPAD